MKITVNKLIAAGLAVIMTVCVAATPVLTPATFGAASSIDTKIKELEKKQAALEAANKKRSSEISSIKGDLNENQEYIAKVKEQITGVTEQIQTYNQLIAAKTSAIESKTTEIAEIEKAIAEAQQSIDDRTKQIGELQEKNDESVREFADLLHAMYINNGEDVFDVLLQSKDFYDLLVQTKIVENISSKTVDFMDELKRSVEKLEQEQLDLEKAKADLQTRKAQLEGQKEVLRSEESDLETKKSEYDTKAAGQRSELETYVSKSDELKDTLSDKESEVKENDKLIESYQSELEALIKEKQAEAARKAEAERQAALEAKRKAEEEKKRAEEEQKRQAEEESSRNAAASASASAAGEFYEPAETLATTAYTGDEPDLTDYTEPAVYGSAGMRWPLDNTCKIITTYFGYDAWRSGPHYGLDIVGPTGTTFGKPIYAAQSGTVLLAFNDGGSHGGYGNYVVIDHGQGITTLYGHSSNVIVTEGQQVKKGDVIAYVGSTGDSTGPHLHFEVRVNSKATDPLNYVNIPA